MKECILILVARPTLEESLVDWLLERPDIGSFTSMPISGHNTDPNELSVHEQVSGRQRQVMFNIRLSEEKLQTIITDLCENFRDTCLEYWALPVLASGRA
ncbi:MAG: DUF3240 family protein [Gammaproteobacteria bacterium]|nr:DUF3240 family protein [Gammaproteobacteria bacterium]